MSEAPTLAEPSTDERLAYMGVVAHLQKQSPADSVFHLDDVGLARWFDAALDDDDSVPVLDFIHKHRITLESVNGKWAAIHNQSMTGAEGDRPEIALKRCWVAKTFGYALDGEPGVGA